MKIINVLTLVSFPLGVFLLGPLAAATKDTPETRIIIVTPRTGDSFVSGDVLDVEVHLDAVLVGKKVYVDAAHPGKDAFGFCSSEAKSKGSLYYASCVIPASVSGSVVITAFAADTPPPWQGGCAGSRERCAAIAAKLPAMSESVTIQVKSRHSP